MANPCPDCGFIVEQLPLKRHWFFRNRYQVQISVKHKDGPKFEDNVVCTNCIKIMCNLLGVPITEFFKEKEKLDRERESKDGPISSES